MRKRTSVFLAMSAATLCLASPSIARTVGASFTSGPTGSFSLTQAHRVAVRHEKTLGLSPAPTVGTCRVIDRHDDGCAVTGTWVVIDGQAPETYTWTAIVTRSGPCSNPGPVVKRVHGITYQEGGHHYGNCFTGPLVVIDSD